VMIVIVIMGILTAIAVPTWWSVVEGRQVDSATNQMVSDLRLANATAANRLVAYQVIFTNGSSSYQVGPAGSLSTRTLPDSVKVSTTLSTIVFKPDGSVTGVTGAANEIMVSKSSPAAEPKYGISINPATSRVKVD
jgi:type II secretory pathway pseudopilin PulG